LITEAKQQRFQGFRPGTIPPHIEPTYRAFAMDECARETVLEAMEQNKIRPFTDARSDILFENVSIPPAPKGKGKKKKKSGRKAAAKAAAMAEPEEQAVEEVPQWRVFDNMKGAIDAGWRVSSIRRWIWVRGFVYLQLNGTPRFDYDSLVKASVSRLRM
jgi:hypothetical protein